MCVEPEAATNGTHREEWFVPQEATHDLPDRLTARNDPEHGRATPGQVWLLQTRCTQPCAQRLEIAPTAPQNCFETIASTQERQRFNSLPPNGPRKSEVSPPRRQAISDPVVQQKRFPCRNAPFGHGDDRAKGSPKSQRTQHLAPAHAERCSAMERERDIGSKFQREGHELSTRQPASVEREHRGDRGGGIGAATAHPRLRRNALGEREARPARKRELLRHPARRPEDEIVAARGH